MLHEKRVLLCNRIGREAASSLFSVRNKSLACGFHALDAIFNGLVLSLDELGMGNFASIIVGKGLL
jgi:hypothetical protein